MATEQEYKKLLYVDIVAPCDDGLYHAGTAEEVALEACGKEVGEYAFVRRVVLNEGIVVEAVDIQPCLVVTPLVTSTSEPVKKAKKKGRKW